MAQKVAETAETESCSAKGRGREERGFVQGEGRGRVIANKDIPRRARQETARQTF